MQPYQPQPYMHRPPPRVMGPGKIILIVAGGVAGVLVLLAAAAVALAPAQHPHRNAAQPAVANNGAGARTPAPAVTERPKARVLATFSGTGDENTPKFTVSGSWKLKWSYNCSAYGYPGNFIVLEDNSYASGAQVNEEGRHGHGATWSYGDSGRHYLNVSSECRWTVKVVGTR